jgi:hypothetical protein
MMMSRIKTIPQKKTRRAILFGGGFISMWAIIYPSASRYLWMSMTILGYCSVLTCADMIAANCIESCQQPEQD